MVGALLILVILGITFGGIWRARYYKGVLDGYGYAKEPNKYPEVGKYLKEYQ